MMTGAMFLNRQNVLRCKRRKSPTDLGMLFKGKGIFYVKLQFVYFPVSQALD
jgi:hypothetical protein